MVMENLREENESDKKRTRVDSADSVSDSHCKKRTRVDSADSVSDCHAPKLVRVDSEADSSAVHLERVDSCDSGSGRVGSEVNSADERQVQDYLLSMLDEPDLVNDRDPTILDLDSFIRSFQEEIIVPEPTPAEMTSDSGEIPKLATSDYELGYLLEASDDELGLPPRSSPSGEEQVIQTVDLEPPGSGIVGFGEMLGFEEQVPSYDSFDLGIDGDLDGRFGYDQSADFVMLGGLFDHADNTETTWQPESLSAL